MAKEKTEPKEIDLKKLINSAYGNRTLFTLDELLKPEVYPTNSHTLNAASGIGGIAKGYIHEIYGQTGSGKTTITLGIIANAQKQGDTALYIDAENRFDYERAMQIGVDVPNLLISQNNQCESVFDIICDVLQTGKVQLVVLDSLATLITENEFESDMEKAEVGNKAKLIGKGLRKILNTIANAKQKNFKVPTVILTNQVRQKVGAYGGGEVTPGGEAPRFFCSQRIKLVAKHFFDAKGKEISTTALAEDEEPIGVRIFHKHVKNSFSPPQQSGTYRIFWNEEVIDNKEELITLGLLKNVIVRTSSSSYQFESEKFVGRDNMINYFRENENALERLKKALDNLNSDIIIKDFISVE